ncbi:translation inhibitor endoribonuclease [Pseudohyphozyma bogoriensis]|nr:translation inhibitor endoribonuclease [Pseudohyphozyma bogoriensis]
MSYTTVATSSAPSAIGPYSQAITAGGLTFLSGCIPLVPETMKVVEGGIEEQTKQALANFTAVVKASGADLSNVVKTTVFLQSMDDFQKFNAIYSAHFEPYKPARSCVEVAKLPLGVLVEVEAIVSHSK